MCQEKNRKKRKRLKNSQSTYADEPIIIGDNDALPSTSGGNKGDNGNSASSSGVILVPTSESNKRLPALLPTHDSPFSSLEPQFFGDLLSQSVIPVDREEPILVGATTADGDKYGTFNTASQERNYTGKNCFFCPNVLHHHYILRILSLFMFSYLLCK